MWARNEGHAAFVAVPFRDFPGHGRPSTGEKTIGPRVVTCPEMPRYGRTSHGSVVRTFDGPFRGQLQWRTVKDCGNVMNVKNYRESFEIASKFMYFRSKIRAQVWLRHRGVCGRL